MQSPNRSQEDSQLRNSKHETPPEKFKSAGERNLQVLNVERFLAVRGNACWPAFDTKATRKRWTNEPQSGDSKSDWRSASAVAGIQRFNSMKVASTMGRHSANSSGSR
ncbi:uncharacterized protein [Drosophila takahashii]|uniref:uncharacterized protein n=1 Tax=Drosophila takahashii TaxID=29030 RepID=UPI001CF84687|nr:uncharacterized protein LOC108061991 [Drosophila takahashii]